MAKENKGVEMVIKCVDQWQAVTDFTVNSLELFPGFFFSAVMAASS